MELGATLPQVRQSTQPTWHSLLRLSVGGRFALAGQSSKSLAPRSRRTQAIGTGGQMPPQVMRSWVMAATATYQARAEATSNPARALVPGRDMAEVTCRRKHATAKNPAGNAVYVGQTEGCSRSPRTKWASPFVPGQHGTPADMSPRGHGWRRAVIASSTSSSHSRT